MLTTACFCLNEMGIANIWIDQHGFLEGHDKCFGIELKNERCDITPTYDNAVNNSDTSYAQATGVKLANRIGGVWRYEQKVLMVKS